MSPPRAKHEAHEVGDDTPPKGSSAPTNGGIKVLVEDDGHGRRTVTARAPGWVVAMLAAVVGGGGATLAGHLAGSDTAHGSPVIEIGKLSAVEARLAAVEQSVAGINGKLDVLIARERPAPK